MGLLKDIFGLGDKKEIRPEKADRMRIDDQGNTKIVYDREGHWKEELRWNPESDRWDKLDFLGNVTGHIEKDSVGDYVHTDYYGNMTGIDKRENGRTIGHYDSKGNKTGYTSRDYNNVLTRHTYTKKKKKQDGYGFIGFVESLYDDVVEFNKKAEAIEKKYRSDSHK